MECPRCDLISPDTALRCDCGWDFSIGSAIKCQRCHSDMEEGMSIGDSYVANTWIKGEQKRGLWDVVKLYGVQRRIIKTYRCVRCGYLESYATEIV